MVSANAVVVEARIPCFSCEECQYGYMDTLNQLSKKENIKAEVVGVFEDSTHKIEFDPLDGIVLERKVFDIDFSIRLKCSIEF